MATKKKSTTKRKRRTKAEIEADKAKELAALAAEDNLTEADPFAFLNDEEESTEEAVEAPEAPDAPADVDEFPGPVEDAVEAPEAPAEPEPVEEAADTPEVPVESDTVEATEEAPVQTKPKVRCATRYHAGRYLRAR